MTTAAEIAKENKERVKELIDNLDYSNPNQIQRYLDWTNKMSKYSAFNRILILEQLPQAQLVGPKSFWNSIGRYPNTSHTARVYQPRPKRIYLDDVPQEEAQSIIDNHNGFRREDGVRAFIKKNGDPVAYREFMSWNSSPVWDISETAGDDLEMPFPTSPSSDEELTGRIDELVKLIDDQFQGNVEVGFHEAGPNTMFNRGVSDSEFITIGTFGGDQRAQLVATYAATAFSVCYMNEEVYDKLRDKGFGSDNLIFDLVGCNLAYREGVDTTEILEGLLNPRSLKGLTGERAMEVMKMMEEVTLMMDSILEGVPPSWAASVMS